MPFIRNCSVRVLICLFLSMFFVAISKAAVTVDQNDLSLENISGHSLDEMRHLKILFGHQSIGMNTILGLKDLGRSNARYRLVISQVSSPADFDTPKLGGFKVGVNGDPSGKIYAFSDMIRDGYGRVVDVAFFKFCPFDVKGHTDIVRLFNIYKKVMASLKAAYPHIVFVHVTCPLVDSEDMANVKRNQFNRMLLNEYGGSDYIFDIASIESTHPDGRRSEFSFGGQTYYKLCSEYRVDQDRVHLNGAGRQRAAKGMVFLLAAIADSR